MKKQAKRVLTYALALVMAFSLLAIPYALAVTVNATDASADIIAYGAFPDGDGIDGAPWRLYSNGELIVSGGFINQELHWMVQNPWERYSDTIVTVTFAEPITAGEHLRGLFYGLSHVTSIEGLTYLDTAKTRDMYRMFAVVGGRRPLDLDLSGFDTSNVRNMSDMFRGTVLTDLDLSSFNTSNVLNMSRMFFDSQHLTSPNLSSFNTGNVTNMSSMFAFSRLTNLDLSHFDTRNVTTMSGMFDGEDSLSQLALGEYFRFVEDGRDPIWYVTDARLPNPPTNEHFTGYWQNVGSGTPERPQGEHIFTASQLMEYYDGSTMADTWVWQPVRDNGFGSVPHTGIFEITWAMYAMLVLAALSVGLWCKLIHPKRRK